jgi:GDP-4-dehydro-6-deoxy-D-mannose reductase
MPPGARILVTGAAGFVGGHLRDALRMAFRDAWLIAAIHRRPAMGWDESVTLDLADAAGLAGQLAAIAPDAVVHLGAQANVAQSFKDVAATWEANLIATLNLGAALMQARPACRLLFASTGEIYGLSFQQGVALDENAPLAPGNPYAAAKAAADIALGEMALRGLAVIRMRPLNHVGPGQSEGYAVAAFARQIALIEAGRQAPVMAVGALERWRDFLDVRDVCAAYAQALAQWERLPNGVALNIASGMPRRIGDVLAGLLARSDRVIRVEEAAHALRPNDVIRSLGDAGRAHAMLGWQPMIDWETTLDDVLTDWRARV